MMVVNLLYKSNRAGKLYVKEYITFEMKKFLQWGKSKMLKADICILICIFVIRYQRRYFAITRNISPDFHP